MRKDPVTPAVAQMVRHRDILATIEWLKGRGESELVIHQWFWFHPVCIAPLVDPNAGHCSGRSTIDHVKSAARMGKRAESDVFHLVSVCEGHSEAGAKAGYQWNTASREKERAYLRAQEGARPVNGTAATSDG